MLLLTFHTHDPHLPTPSYSFPLSTGDHAPPGPPPLSFVYDMQVQHELEQERTLVAEEEDLGNRDGDEGADVVAGIADGTMSRVLLVDGVRKAVRVRLGEGGREGLDLGGFGWDEGLGFGGCWLREGRRGNCDGRRRWGGEVGVRSLFGWI